MKKTILFLSILIGIVSIFVYELQRIQKEAAAQTIWGSAHLVTGPVPAIASFLHRTPVVGSLFSAEFSRITQQRTYVRLTVALHSHLWRELPLSVGVVVTPKFLDSPKAYRRSLIALDDYLQFRQENARIKTLPTSNASRESKSQAHVEYLEIASFRKILGVPVRIRNSQEFDALPIGTEFIGPSGTADVKLY